MTGERDRHAAKIAALRHAARAMMARIQAMGRLSRGLGIATVLRPAGRVAQMPDRARAMLDRRIPAVPTMAPAETRRQLFARQAAPRFGRRSIASKFAGAMTATKMTGTKMTATAAGAARAMPVASRWAAFATAIGKRAERMAGRHVAGGLRAMSRDAPHLARRVSPGHDGARRGHSSSAVKWPGQSPTDKTIAVAHADVPSFHRTVRHTRGAAAAGDVFLDRDLVGYHLAAAITAEQTRAAARPNISGSGFNGSMAALRPSGAGS